MRDPQADLRSYYEAEARLRTRTPLRGGRVELRGEFIAMLVGEKRKSVLDYGAGPGLDAADFVTAGLRFVGIDLAHGNAALAGESGVAVIQGSIDAPPIRPSSFDAGWSMSTLMHVPEDRVVDTLAAMCVPLRSGAPLMIGLWGGRRRDYLSTAADIKGHRFFSMREQSHNRELVSSCGAVEREQTWDTGPQDQEYQTFLVRVPTARGPVRGV